MNFRLFVLLSASAGLLAAADTGVDASAIDRGAEPCVDFYQYACGGWIAHNPLPADRSRWSRFAELAGRTERVLLDLLQSAAVDQPGRSALDQKIGDYYQSCLDTAAVNQKGISVLLPELNRIRDIQEMRGMAAEVARLHLLGVRVLFAFGPRPDARDSSRTIASLTQGGLSLPDREYYLDAGAKSEETRRRFQEHVKKMLQLAGESADAAAVHAQAVLALEIRLARASADRVSLRVPEKNYHILSTSELAAVAPDFAWDAYFTGSGAPRFATLNVGQPDYFRQLETLLRTEPVESWKIYLAYHLIRESASRLSEPFEREDFDFWDRYLGGAKEPRPRASRCLQDVDRELGDLLGRKYVDSEFGPEARERISRLVDALVAALEKDIHSLPWMSGETRQAAVAKLHAVTRNIGYPNKWRDYSRTRIARDDYFGNFTRTAAVLHDLRMERIGRPTEKDEWTNMTAPTVNAFYIPSTNSINFPAGILQEPFFDPRRDGAVNFGGIGSVIGHEMTHGFDDSGRKYDGAGNLRDWWTPADAAEFEKRAACVANEYSSFTPVADVRLNGRLTLGENTADNGGVRIALMALMDTLEGREDTVDGFTPPQRFFLGFAQVFCENIAPEQLRMRALTDPHSPGRFRVNGTVQNMPEFQKAFSCKVGQPMVSANACRVW
ncbi:MAG TPA: M13 family metallopeptidase [Bryobacteraceae bacterium]|nr:M13 family metallopeptidase [Bryobacteraceae bacterium]